MVISAQGLVSSQIAEHERRELSRCAQHTVPVRVLNQSTLVHFDDPESARHFAARYRDLRALERAAIRTYVVRDERGNTHFWTADGAAYTWPHGPLWPAAVAFLADAVAMRALLTAIPSTIALHAAALHVRGRTFAITGHSTAGKSTTAVACVAAGSALYSDERCIVTPAGVLPFPRAVNLRAGGIDLLVADLPPGPLRSRLETHHGRDWDNVRFGELFGPDSLPPIQPLSALFAIVGRNSEPRSRRISAVEMFGYAQFGAITSVSGIDRASEILRMLHDIACYEIVLGGPHASAQHLIHVVGETSAP